MALISALQVAAGHPAVQEVHGSFSCTNCDSGPSWWQSVLTAVLAGVIAAGSGSFFAFKFSQKLLAHQTAEQLKVMARQTQQDAAIRVDQATAELAEQVRGASVSGDSPVWAMVGEIVRTRLFSELGQLDQPDLASRIDSLNTAILQAYLKPSPMTRWGVLCACDSLRAGLAEFLQGKPLTPAKFPTTKELMKLLWGGGREEPNIEAYTRVLTGFSSEGESE